MNGKATFPGALDALMLTLTGLFAMALTVGQRGEGGTAGRRRPRAVIGFGVTGTRGPQRSPHRSPRGWASPAARRPSSLSCCYWRRQRFASELDNICRALLPATDTAEVTARRRASVATRNCSIR